MTDRRKNLIEALRRLDRTLNKGLYDDTRVARGGINVEMAVRVNSIISQAADMIESDYELRHSLCDRLLKAAPDEETKRWVLEWVGYTPSPVVEPKPAGLEIRMAVGPDDEIRFPKDVGPGWSGRYRIVKFREVKEEDADGCR